MRTLAAVLAAPLAGSLDPARGAAATTEVRPRFAGHARRRAGAERRLREGRQRRGAAASFFANSGPKVGELTSKTAVAGAALLAGALAPGGVVVGGAAALLGGGLRASASRPRSSRAATRPCRPASRRY